jgi:single-strand DNA-binding protein
MNTPAPGDFTISPRQYTDDEAWFGLHANPAGTINVPVTDHYQVFPDPAAPWHHTEPDTIQTEHHSTGKAVTMSGETTITVIGNLTNDPELRFTPVSREFGKTEGTPVANFTIASTPRTFDAQSKEWKDGETLFLRSTVWREAAEHVAASLAKGSRVVANGRLKPRTYETKTGEKRTVIEFEIEEIGLSLRYGPVSRELTKSEASSAENRTTKDAVIGGIHPADEFTISPREFADDDAWFGARANPGGRVHIAGVTAEPPTW